MDSGLLEQISGIRGEILGRAADDPADFFDDDPALVARMDRARKALAEQEGKPPGDPALDSHRERAQRALIAATRVADVSRNVEELRNEHAGAVGKISDAIKEARAALDRAASGMMNGVDAKTAIQAAHDALFDIRRDVEKTGEGLLGLASALLEERRALRDAVAGPREK